MQCRATCSGRRSISNRSSTRSEHRPPDRQQKSTIGTKSESRRAVHGSLGRTANRPCGTDVAPPPRMAKQARPAIARHRPWPSRNARCEHGAPPPAASTPTPRAALPRIALTSVFTPHSPVTDTRSLQRTGSRRNEKQDPRAPALTPVHSTSHTVHKRLGDRCPVVTGREQVSLQIDGSPCACSPIQTR